jgi:hypothetical protein
MLRTMIEKKYGFFLIAIFIVLTACQSNHAHTDESSNLGDFNYKKEKQAILQVIENESKAHWNKDFEEFASYWAHEEYIRTHGWWERGGVTIVEGWEERSRKTKIGMAKSPESNANATKVRRENINLRIFQDVAWMTFDQYGEDTGDPTTDMPGLSRETRILEKHNGQWKIVYVGWLLEG